MVIYLDGVMGLNFLIDWCLLLGVNRLAGYQGGLGRTAAGAAVGGGYAGMCVVPAFGFLRSNVWRVVSLGIMSVAAFGMNRGALRRSVLFVLLSFALGGLAVSFDLGDFSGLGISAGVLAGVCHFGFQGKGVSRQIVDLSMEYRGKCVRIPVLVDTGNLLRDPLTGECVTVVDGDCAWELAGLEQRDLLHPVQALTDMQHHPLRLIPYKTVGKEGMLLALRCDCIRIGGRDAGRLVAFSPEGFAQGEYRGLTGGLYG